MDAESSVMAWLDQQLGPSVSDRESLIERLKDGVQLCELINSFGNAKVKIRKIHNGTKLKDYHKVSRTTMSLRSTTSRRLDSNH